MKLTHVGRNSAIGKLRMCKLNAKRAVPLDAVPERRTKRCSPRFRPGYRFCELSFRYLSPGSEGERCRRLDHLWKIPFIHSARFVISSNFFIYLAVVKLFLPFGTFKCVFACCSFDNCVCASAETFIIIKVLLCSMRYVLVHTGTK